MPNTPACEVTILGDVETRVIMIDARTLEYFINWIEKEGYHYKYEFFDDIDEATPQDEAGKMRSELLLQEFKRHIAEQNQDLNCSWYRV